MDNKHKIALDRDDDERLVQTDGITTLTRGCVTSALGLIQPPIKNVLMVSKRP